MSPPPSSSALFSLAFDLTRSDNVTVGSGQLLGSPLQLNGMYSDLRGELSYRKTRPRKAFGADAATTLHYYPQLEQTIPDYGGGVSWETAIGRQARLSLSQGITSSQSYQPTLFPALPGGRSGSLPGERSATAGSASLPALPALRSETIGAGLGSSAGDALSRLGVNTYSTRIGLTRGLGARSSVEIGYDFRMADFTGHELDLRTSGVQGRFTRRVTRYAALRLGYGQRRIQGLVSSPTETGLIHDVDFGIDFNRTFALSRSKQTAISFTPGSSIVTGPEGRRYDVAGNLALLHRMGRSWTAQLRYARGVQVVDGFSALFFSDSVTASVGGNLGQRLSLATSGGYSNGAIQSGQGTYASYSAGAQANIALGRQWALSFEHLYYQHQFPAAIALPTGVPPELGRHSMRMGLRWATPLLR